MRATLIFVSILLGSALQIIGAEPIRIGFAEADISPKIGMERPGGYGKSYHTKFHDPCKARAAVFDDGKNPIALVGLDALIIRKQQVDQVREMVAKSTGIAPEAVLIGASHSHSSGPVGMILPGEFDHADPWIQELAYEQSSTADPEYLRIMVNGIVDAIEQAWVTRSELQLSFGSGIEETVSFNRRHRMANGQTWTHPQAGNPDMGEYAGPIDPEVGVIGAWDGDGNLVGCVVNFACHATTSPPGISANFIYYVEQAIRGMFGDDVVVCFLNGASADVTQVNNLSPWARPDGKTAAIKVGGRVGAEAVKVLTDARARTGEVTLEYAQKILEIPRRTPSEETLAASQALAGQPMKPEDSVADWLFAKEILLLQALIDQEPVRKVEVQALQIGPAVFLTTPAEYFCQFGLDQKAVSEFPFTWPVSLANGCIGYVPTEEALGPNGGGYETRLTSYSNLVPEAGRQLADAGLELAGKMKPDELVTPPPAREFKGQGWSYGSLGPQLD